MDLDSKKYAELQSIAKELGLKANMKADKLLKAIKQHYQQEKSQDEEQKNAAAVQEDENAARDQAQEDTDSSCKEEVSSATVFVNTRRGKGNGTKRKISDTGTVTECESKDDAEVAVPGAPCGAKGKKRKMSSVCGSDKSEPQPPKEAKAGSHEQQPDIKDAEQVQGNAVKAPKVIKAGKIPRYQGTQQKNKPALKPVTPNFKKLHEAHFNKMESIDSYVERKTKHMDAYRNSVKELKAHSEKNKLQGVDGKTQAQAKNNVASMFSPITVKKSLTEEKRRHTLLSASKAPPKKAAGKEDAPFRPSVLSTRRINVRFSEATRDNEYKRSLVKTPARMSPCVASSTPQKQTPTAMKSNTLKTSTLSATKTPGPFIFTGNTSVSATPGTQKKTSFDLQASLARPLSYKPHKGKLRPFGEIKENTTAENTVAVPTSHQKNYKQHQVKTREDRRAKQVEDRKQKKANMLGARRGLVIM